MTADEKLKYLKDFEDAYITILERTKEETDAKIVMFETFYLQEEDKFNRRLNIKAYNEIIHRLSSEYDAILIPVHSAFKKARLQRPWQSWTTQDGVHPSPLGHTLMALTFLETMEWG